MADHPCIIHRWKGYCTVCIRRKGQRTHYNRIGGLFYNVREAWDFAREELEYLRHQIKIFDHLYGRTNWKNLP